MRVFDQDELKDIITSAAKRTRNDLREHHDQVHNDIADAIEHFGEMVAFEINLRS